MEGIFYGVLFIGGVAFEHFGLNAYKNFRERGAKIDENISTQSEQTAALKEPNPVTLTLNAETISNADHDWHLICKWERSREN